jgi:Reverse transcriptase (RNA-dependent DNA polymerase)
MWSLEGVQQGDPLGPLLFCLTVQPLLRSLSCQMIVAFMDDVTLGGQLSSVADDVTTISTQGFKYGLQLNFNKCEATTLCGSASHTMLEGFQQLVPETATLYSVHLQAQVRLYDLLSFRSLC